MSVQVIYFNLIVMGWVLSVKHRQFATEPVLFYNDIAALNTVCVEKENCIF